jgi:hypothetical protein
MIDPVSSASTTSNVVSIATSGGTIQETQTVDENGNVSDTVDEPPVPPSVEP